MEKEEDNFTIKTANEIMEELTPQGWYIHFGSDGCTYNTIGKSDFYTYLCEQMKHKKYWDDPANHSPDKKEPNLFKRFHPQLWEVLDKIEKYGVDNRKS